jgi:hypothetical protein
MVPMLKTSGFPLFCSLRSQKKSERQKQMQNFKSKRRQDKIEPDEVRTYKLRVMLNSAELAFLDSVRGRHSRAETMRFLLNNERPPQVPELNAGAWVELSKSAANLNQIALKLNTGEFPEIAEIREMLSQLRASLLGADLSRVEE